MVQQLEIYLSRPANLPNGLYILPTVISFFNSRQIISGSTEPIFVILAPNDRYLLEYDWSGLLFWFFKGCCHGNQLKSKNLRFYGPIYFVALPFGNGLQYRNSDFKRLDRMNFSTLCSIWVTFGPETPEFTLLTITPFVAIWQKSAYHTKYLRMCWTYLYLLYRFGRRISGDDFPNIRLAVAQGTLLWQVDNQLNMGDVRKRREEPPLLFPLAFDNGLADRRSAFKRFNGNNQDTSCPNLVNFRPVISEFTLLKRAIFAAIRPQFDDDLHDLHSSRWRFQTDWKIAILISAE